MKTKLLATILSAALAACALPAQTTPVTENALEPVVPEQGQLEILMAPIALYPDALVALILPAATHPSDIVLASRFLSSGGKEEEIDAQLWDESVKSLARFPEVIAFLDENLGWTQDVGDAFVAQPAMVMGAIQALRSRASRNGTLANTPQQQVVFEDDETIRIVPTEPTVIYVPYYEPSILYPTYSYSYFPSSLVWFGVGYGIGSWLSYDCDWGRRTVWVHHHRGSWGRDYDWRRRYHRDWGSRIGGNDWTCWTPSTNYRRSRPRGDYNYTRTVITNTSRNRYSGDRTRFDTGGGARRESTSTFNRDATSTQPAGERSIRRPDGLRTPGRLDRSNDTDRASSDRRDRRPNEDLTRYTDRRDRVDATGTPRTGSSTTDVQRRNQSPVRRVPDASTRRPDSVDRRPEVARSNPTRRESPPAVRAPAVTRPAPQPARTITSASQLRQPQPSRASAPQPAPSRPASYSSPAPARQPSYSAPRSSAPAQSSPPPRTASSIRHRQVEKSEN